MACCTPGETWQYTCPDTVPGHLAGEDDPFTNSATADGEDLDGEPLAQANDDLSVDIDHDAGTLSISKLADVSDVAHGGTVTYTFYLNYTPGGDGSPASNPDITDPRCNSAPTYFGGDDGDNLLETGETWVYTCTFLVPASHADGEEDPILNTASVTGLNLDGDQVTPDDSNEVSVNIIHDAGALTIVKSADVADVAHGGTVTYTFDVSYTPGLDGSPAQNIVVSDPQCTSLISGPDTSIGVDADNDLDALLEANETWRYTCTFTVPGLHIFGEEDPILNTASVAGQDLDGEAVAGDSSDQVSVNILHDSGALSIAKSADSPTVAHGGTVTYTFDVSYTPGADGSPAQNIVVTDAQCTSAVSAPDKSPTADPDNDLDTLLEANEAWRYTCTFLVPASHVVGEEDPISNQAFADGEDLDGQLLTQAASNTVLVSIIHADLSITKTASADPVAVGDEFDYTITVTNNGPSDNGGFTVTDVLPIEVSFVSESEADCTFDLIDTVMCINAGLANGDSVTYTFTVQADLVPGAVNIAQITATGTVDPNAANDIGTSTIAIVPGTLLSDVAAGDPEWQNEIDGVDVLFQKNGSGSSTTYKLKATNPGTFKYRLSLENETGMDIHVRGHQLPNIVRNGVTLKDRNGASTTVFLTVPSMPSSVGTGIYYPLTRGPEGRACLRAGRSPAGQRASG